MRFLLIIKATGYSEAGVNRSREHNDAMKEYKQLLAKNGTLLAAEKLQPSSTGVRITYPSLGGEPEILVGPFPHQELISEYTLIDVNTESEALKWALCVPVPEGRGGFEIELRRLEEESSDVLRVPRNQAMEADLQDQLDMFNKIAKP
ncbi:YciI family protein [Paenibacillus radicis (ex Xue et al. 2023)]|uniref:YciI family protein n=1 Tax=Paenibacillus radicis (ex Xue et al. 2023) TaxID=2972489 RepID=A0ABT1YTX9_9BACL|nr:YciI family protein [Paenibacillus radicis (ex Xue et al. 2023)]MCR8636647.1 YciI family protein [Paenibacillus radicis (ex Xue et al. 2023)]